MQAVHRMMSGLLVATAIAWAGGAGAEPLDLHDPTPRWIEVSFEASPEERPAQRNAFWGAPLRAWFRPAVRPGWVIVAIPPEVIENQLLVSQEPVPGTFGPMVWILDTKTGHVLSADLEGAVYRRLRVGFLKPRVKAEVRFEMGTDRVAGFRRPKEVLGLRVFEYCDAPDEDCTLVPASALDPATGYVNAVGRAHARFHGISNVSFSAMGEARFTENEKPVLAGRDSNIR